MSTGHVPTVIIGADMPAELAADVSHALEALGVAVRSGASAPEMHRGKVIVVMSPKGGSGKTAIASNLAVACAQRCPGRVVVVDLDVQFGDIETALSLDPERTMAQLTRAANIDATTVKLHLTPSDHGLYVLAGAKDPIDADAIRHEHVPAILSLLAEHFDYVIVDTAAGLDDLTLAALECATHLLLVSTLDVTSLRSLRKATDALDHLGVTADRGLVLNRADSKVGLDPSDAEEVIGMPITCSIPSSRDIPLSLNLGTPVVVSQPRSAVARQLQQLSRIYAPVESERTKRGWRR